MHVCIGEGNGNPLQYSCLENPRDGGAWWVAVYGVARSQTHLKRLSSNSSIHRLKFLIFYRTQRILRNVYRLLIINTLKIWNILNTTSSSLVILDSQFPQHPYHLAINDLTFLPMVLLYPKQMELYCIQWILLKYTPIILFMNCCCSAAQSFLTLFDPMDCTMSGFLVLHASKALFLFVFEEPIVWLYYNLSVHQLTNIWNVSRFQLVINNLQISVYNYAFILRGKYLRIKNELYSKCMCNYQNFPNCFLKWLYHFAFTPTMYENYSQCISAKRRLDKQIHYMEYRTQKYTNTNSQLIFNK